MQDAPDPHLSPQRRAGEHCERVRRVIDDGAVAPVYQPLVHLISGGVIGYEALTRVDAETGFHSTAELFDRAHATGALWDLETITRARCLETPHPWPDDCLLFLNCNPEVAADPRFAAELLTLLRDKSALPPSRIVVEITERAETQFTRGLAAQVHHLREAGVQIAIDDMGAGTSGLQRIMELRPDWLKLDRDLIANIDTDPFTQNLVDVLLRFTRVSGARLVAEGVERREQISTLLELGVQYVQGYLLGRPAQAPAQLENGLVTWIETEVRRVESSRVTQHLTFVAGIARDAIRVDANATLAETRRMLARQKDAPGLVVLRKGAPSGWADRDAVLHACAHDPAGEVGSIMRQIAPLASATTLVSEALLLLSTRPTERIADPVLIERDDDSIGVVPVTALLREASRLTALADRPESEISGLPGRVKTDQRISAFLRRQTNGCALFVDIREFHKYNDAAGFELGDLILRILAGVLISTVENAGLQSPGFAGHLGDDRFVVVLPEGDVSVAAEQIVAEFEASSDRFVTCAHSHDGVARSLAAGLRIVGMHLRPGVFDTPRDLQNTAWRTRMLGAPRMVGRSHIYFAPSLGQREAPQARRIA